MRVTAWHVLVALTAAVILGAAPLPQVDADAPLYGRVAARVLTSGDWLTFREPGWLVDKPPLVFWIMAASFRLLGISDVSLRLWQLLLALALLALTAAAARAAGASSRDGLLAALVLGTALQLFYQVTVPQQDVALTLFLTVAVFALMRYAERGGVGWVMLSGGAAALAVLTKGLAGLALYAVIVALALPLVRRSLPHPGRRVLAHALAGACVFAVVGFPWYVHGAVTQGQVFVDTFLTSGSLGVARFFRPAGSTPPYWLSVFAYVPLLCLGLLPWTPGFLVGLASLPRMVRGGPPGLKIVVAWLLGIFVMLSLSSGDKVFRYLLPVYPPAAIVTGKALGAFLAGDRRLRTAGWIAVTPAVLLIAAGFWTLWAAFPPERGLLVAVVLPTVVMLGGAVIVFGVAALAGRARLAIIGAALCAMVAYAAFERSMLVNAAAIDPWPTIALAAAPYAAAADRIVLYGRVGEVSNFARFHFDAPIAPITAVHELIEPWQRERVLAVVPAERLSELAALRPAPVVVLESPARLVLVANWSATR